MDLQVEKDFPVATAMLEKAQRFIATLHPPQRETGLGNEYTLYSFEDARRTSFDYFAPSSQFTFGLPLRYMNPQQQQAAIDLLQASLSPEGFKQVQQLALLEQVLETREQANPLFVRDSLAYYVAIFGTPAATGPWSWRYQGHHVALHWTILDNAIISTTPQFIGAQPLEVLPTDWHSADLPAGTRVLDSLETTARTLIKLLTPTQQQQARASTPWDLETTNAARARFDRRPNRFEDRGVAFASLTPVQQQQLRAVVQAHAAYQLPAVAAQRLQRIEATNWAGVKFYLMGGYQPADALYYRVRGNAFVLEYLNKAFTAADLLPDHQHSVWRDFDNDWGLELLAKATLGAR